MRDLIVNLNTDLYILSSPVENDIKLKIRNKNR